MQNYKKCEQNNGIFVHKSLNHRYSSEKREDPKKS